MNESRRNKATTVAVMTMLTCLGLVSEQSFAAGTSRIIDGSSVTVLYEITVPGERGFEVRDVGRFVQGEHQLLPALERVVAGLATGEEKNVQLSAEDGFGPYDANKMKTVPRKDLPAGTKEGDVLEDRTGKAAIVARLSDQSAVMDYNHPLAGKSLSVKIRILAVEDPS